MSSVYSRTAVILERRCAVEKYDINSLCRLCLNENDVCFPIFDFIDKNHVYGTLTLRDRIMICGLVKVEKEDGLPDSICKSCFDQVDKAFLFKEQCKRTDFTLRKFMNRHLTINQSSFLSKTVKCGYSLDISTASDGEAVSQDVTSDPVCDQNDDIRKDEKISNEELSCDARRKPVVINRAVKKRLFKCEPCMKTFNSHSALHYHKLKHDNLKRHECRYCDKLFYQKCTLVRHERTHTGEKPFACDRCGKSFAQESHRQCHMVTHVGDKEFCCHVCGKAFTLGHNLNEHLKIHTARQRAYECETCGKKFYHRTHLANHAVTHSGLKPFVCDLCGKQFGKSAYLKQHRRIHTGEKPFSCPLCGKSFTSSGNLSIHVRSHSRTPKKYICQLCNRSFLNKTKLFSHSESCRGNNEVLNDTIILLDDKQNQLPGNGIQDIIIVENMDNIQSYELLNADFNISDNQTVSLEIVPLSINLEEER